MTRLDAWEKCLLGLWAVTIVAVLATVVFAEQPPVDPLTQCRAMVELVVKDRANAQMEAAYFAARTKALTEENEALKAKVKDLEPKKEPNK